MAIIMKKTLRNYTIAGIIFVSILGTLLHFVYEWTGNNFFIGLIAPVSESTWEHMKLLFFPMLLYSVFMKQRLSQDFPCIASSLSAGILAGCLLIPVLFYTYTGILGFHIGAVDIAIFYLSVIFAFSIAYLLTRNCHARSYGKLLYAAVLLLLILFLLFTYAPPGLALFAAPESAG